MRCFAGLSVKREGKGIVVTVFVTAEGLCSYIRIGCRVRGSLACLNTFRQAFGR
jgi:hypothetical protein